MTFAVFHDYPGLEYGLPKFHDFPGPVVTLSVKNYQIGTFPSISFCMFASCHSVGMTNHADIVTLKYTENSQFKPMT